MNKIIPPYQESINVRQIAEQTTYNLDQISEEIKKGSRAVRNFCRTNAFELCSGIKQLTTTEINQLTNTNIWDNYYFGLLSNGIVISVSSVSDIHYTTLYNYPQCTINLSSFQTPVEQTRQELEKIIRDAMNR